MCYHDPTCVRQAPERVERLYAHRSIVECVPSVCLSVCLASWLAGWLAVCLYVCIHTYDMYMHVEVYIGWFIRTGHLQDQGPCLHAVNGLKHVQEGGKRNRPLDPSGNKQTRHLGNRNQGAGCNTGKPSPLVRIFTSRVQRRLPLLFRKRCVCVCVNGETTIFCDSSFSIWWLVFQRPWVCL